MEGRGHSVYIPNMEHENHNQDDFPDSPEMHIDMGSDEASSQGRGRSRRPWEDLDLDEEEGFSESDRDSRNFYTFRNPDEESIF
jgi:hypothetical protein